MNEMVRNTGLSRTAVWSLCIAAVTLVAALAVPGASLAQSVTIENEHVTIQDSLAATQVDLGPQVIVEGDEIRVLGPGPDIQALIDAISDASAAKPYLIRLGRGVYDLTSGLVMKPYVSLVGGGEDATLLRADAAIESLVTGADNMAITDMTIRNNGGHAAPKAISNSSASPRIERVTARASGGESYAIYCDSSAAVISDVTAEAIGTTDSYGIYVTGVSASMNKLVMTHVSASATDGSTENYAIYTLASSSPEMTDVTATASGGGTNVGVYNDSSSPTMRGVTASGSGLGSNYGVYNDTSSPEMFGVVADASGGGVLNAGVYNTGSSPEMIDVEASGSGGTVNYGVRNDASSSPMMLRVEATGSGGDLSYGVYNNSSSPEIYNSLAKAENGSITTSGIDGIDADTRVITTQVIGGVSNDASGTQCQNVYDDTPAAVGC